MDLIRNDVKVKMVAKVGDLYGRLMEELAFRHDRHEQITRYIRMYALISNGNACVFYL